MRKSEKRRYQVICIGVSAGGIKAVQTLLSCLPKDFSLPIVVAQHLSESQDTSFTEAMNSQLALKVKVAEDKETMEPGFAYYAPPNYHLLVEEDGTFSLSIDEKVNYSRPSIDVLFESVVDSFAPDIIGIILTGANRDGALGMKLIQENGGTTIVQDPKTAEASVMPEEAIKAASIDYVLPLEGIGKLLKKIGEFQQKNYA